MSVSKVCHKSLPPVKFLNKSVWFQRMDTIDKLLPSAGELFAAAF